MRLLILMLIIVTSSYQISKLKAQCPILLNEFPSATAIDNRTFTIVGENLFFVADDGIHGKELWISDGTVEGTQIVKDLTIGSSSSFLHSLVSYKNELYFILGQAYESRLWKSDGTESGTVKVSEDARNPFYLTVSNGNLVFRAYNSSGFEPWISDGTDEGTKILKNIRNLSLSSNPSSFYDVNGKCFFVARDELNITRLWKSDGTESGTTIVNIANDSLLINSNYEFYNHNDHLIFTASNGHDGWEPWISDGTDSGTFMIQDVNPGSQNSFPRSFASENGLLFFSATSEVSGYELWVSDGTELGTMMLKDLYPGTSGSYPEIINVNNEILLKARSLQYGTEIFISNGTESGTQVLKDIAVGSPSSNPHGLTVLDNKLIFRARNSDGKLQYWKSDGSVEGTAPFCDQDIGIYESGVSNSNSIYFRGYDINLNMSGVYLITPDNKNCPTSDQIIYIPADGTGCLDTSNFDLTGFDYDSVFFSKTKFNCNNIIQSPILDSLIGITGTDTTICTFEVTVLDTLPPYAECSPDTAYLNAIGSILVLGSEVLDTVYDNCGVDFISASTFWCGNIGDNIMPIAIQDVSDNAIFCNTTITVLDTIKPMTDCSDLTVYLDNNGLYSLSIQDSSTIVGVPTDNCSVDSIHISQTDFICADIPSSVIDIRVWDQSENSNSCTSIITVVDTVGPILECQDLEIELLEAKSVMIVPGDAIISDMDCLLDSYSLSKDTFDCTDDGSTTEVLLTATDGYGNSSTCQVQVTVTDPHGYCCPDQLTVSGTPIDSLNYFASDSILVSGLMSNPHDVNFRSTNVLMDSLTVDQGVQMQVINEDCGEQN